MNQVTMHDLEQFSYWMEKRIASSHWYNPYNPLIKIDSVERENRYAGGNDAVEEIQLDVEIQLLCYPESDESLLMSMSDALLRELERWITEQGLPMKTLTLVSLSSVEPLPLPLTRSLGILTNIPVFAYCFLEEHHYLNATNSRRSS